MRPRDYTVLTWIGQQYSIRLDTLQILLGRHADNKQQGQVFQRHMRDALAQGKTVNPPDPNKLSMSSVYTVVSRWKKNGWVESAQVVGGVPAFVWLTQSGLDSVGLSFRSISPSLSLIRHTHAVTKVRLRMEELYPDSIWVPERELRQQINLLSDNQKARVTHIPDGEMHHPGGKRDVIEVELSKKTEKRLREIMLGLKKRYGMDASAGVKIYYFVNDETKKVVNRAVQSLSTQGQQSIFSDRHMLEVVQLKGGYA